MKKTENTKAEDEWQKEFDELRKGLAHSTWEETERQIKKIKEEYR